MDPNHNPRHRDAKAPAVRSILRPSSASRRSPPQEGPSVRFQTSPSRPSSSESSSQSIYTLEIPQDGPIPPLLLPATQSRRHLEALVLQLAAQLRAQRIASQSLQEPFTRPEGKADEFPEFRDIMLDKWTAGPGYGPVLNAESVAKLRLHPLLHPVLSSPPSDDDHLIWNMIYPPSTAERVRKNVREAFDSFRLEPATLPRVSILHIASRRMPWVFIVRPDDDAVGVTVGDVLTVLARYLSVHLNEADLSSTTVEHRKAIVASHEARMQILQSERKLSIQVVDWMVGHTHFTGFFHDVEYLEGRFPDTPTNLHIVLCSESSEMP
ncbi:uncharacterized protein EV420DRAFT_1505533 [Desarmillaria tabescens]|uniref:DUF6699 domain-containing protein n=1 Tax=Armillaria tabescens TaxID=1929756 RepID=A0AA39NJR3_ARMTA|nr:uncharacterized protein EV420DRAFT_1505533 [Desarmillaria tabescens]KAK0466819.1 hypothetical protein EV420DRAFT_1505533 [Desarmillaria tabescens]